MISGQIDLIWHVRKPSSESNWQKFRAFKLVGDPYYYQVLEAGKNDYLKLKVGDYVKLKLDSNYEMVAEKIETVTPPGVDEEHG